MHRVDVTGLDAAALREAVAAESDAATDRLDPDAGTMLSAVWFDAGPQELGRLLLVAHHLVVDGVSWRTLIEDLAMAWVAADSGQSAGRSTRWPRRCADSPASSPSRRSDPPASPNSTTGCASPNPVPTWCPARDGHAVVSSGARRTVRAGPATHDGAC